MPDGSGMAEITITCFDGFAATRKTDRRLSWEQLIHEVRTTTAQSKVGLPWLKLARFGDIRSDKGSLRHDANVLSITGIEADYDGEKISPETALAGC